MYPVIGASGEEEKQVRWCTHHTKCLQACSAMVCGCYWSGQGSATVEWDQLTTWIYRMKRLFHQWIFFFSDGTGIFEDDNPRIVELWKRGSGNTRHHFHKWMGHQITDLNRIKNFWDVLEKVCAAIRFYHQQCKILVKNVYFTGL